MRNLLVFLYIYSITVVSCKYNCPGYDTTDKSNIPFEQNDTIYYISNANDTIKLLVFNTYFEGASSSRGLAMDYECSPTAYYEAIDDKTGVYIKEQHVRVMSVFFNKDTEYKNISYDIENDMKCKFTTDKKIGEIIYSFVWEVEDLSGNRRIDKFIKVGFHGILEFHDKETGLTWTQIIR